MRRLERAICDNELIDSTPSVVPPGLMLSARVCLHDALYSAAAAALTERLYARRGPVGGGGGGGVLGWSGGGGGGGDYKVLPSHTRYDALGSQDE